MTTVGAHQSIRRTIPARLDRLGWSPFHTFDIVGRKPMGTSRTGLFIGYLVGAGVMIAGGIVELVFGIKAEGKSLESVTKPLTSTDEPPSVAVAPSPA